MREAEFGSHFLVLFQNCAVGEKKAVIDILCVHIIPREKEKLKKRESAYHWKLLVKPICVHSIYIFLYHQKIDIFKSVDIMHNPKEIVICRVYVPHNQRISKLHSQNPDIAF